MPVTDDKGRSIQLGSEIARGGEGAVYELPSDPTVVAKLYFRSPDNHKASKLSAMVQTATPDIGKFAAWPSGTLRKDGHVTGILMPRVAARSRPIHELYTPKTRLREFPTANWQFLVNVAANVTRGFAVIHRTGHVIGDVNHGNILVAPNGITAFIDCDSFQIRSNGEIYLCEVGVSTYTPPELQNKPFNNIVRTPNHDCFGLAVLLFHLLFMGRHPFAGRYAGPGYMPIERAIGEGRFAFGRLASQMLMSPPPDSLLLNQVPATVADAFERAFGIEATRGTSRPQALEWLAILEQFQRELTRCGTNRSHVYFSRVAACPWCPIEAHGVILFVDVEVSVATGLDIESLWRKLTNLSPLGDLPPVPTIENRKLTITPNPEARTSGRTRKLRMGVGVLIIIVTICAVVGLNVNGLVALVLVGMSIGVAYRLPREFQQKRAVAVKNWRECQDRYEQLQTRYRSECSDSTFRTKAKDVGGLRDEYNQLPVLKRRKVQELEKNKFQLQLHEFLDRINLSDAHIPSIGAGRKAMLASYGIDTAADVSYGSVTQVPGIGPTFATRLLAWRQVQESRFKFDSNRAISKAELDKVDREIRTLRMKLEEGVTRGIQEAVTFHGRTIVLRRNYLEQLEVALTSLAQAEANMRVS